MKRPLLMLAGLLTGGLTVGAATLSRTELPGWVERTDWKPSAVPATVDSDYQDLVQDVQINRTTDEIYFRIAFRYLTPRAVQDSATVKIDYQPDYQTVQLHILRLWRDGRPIDQRNLVFQSLQRERGLEALTYDGSQTWVAIPKDVRPGDVIELAYTIRGSNPVFGGKFFDSYSVESGYQLDRSLFRVLSTPGMAPELRVLGSEQKPELRTVQGLAEQRVELHDVPAIVSEERAPPDSTLATRYVLSDWRTWAEVRDWALPLYQRQTSPEVASLAHRIADQAASPDESASLLLSFVQDKIRYFGVEVGAGSHRPRTPDEVLDAGFGDCKDKAVLFCSLAREVGVEAWPVLVNNRTGGLVNSDGPTPGAFNHVIAAVLTKAGTKFVDPTMDHQGGTIDRRVLGNYSLGLELRPDGEGLTPITGPSEGTRDLLETLRFPDFESEGEVEFEITFTGWDADSQRAKWDGRDKEKWRKETQEWLSDQYGEATLKDGPEFRDDRTENVVRLRYTFSLEKYWKLSGNQYEAESYPWLIGENLYNPQSLAARRQPYTVEYPVTVHQVRRISVPVSWSVTPSEQIVSGPAFRLWTSAKLADPHTLEFEDTYVAMEPRVEATDWDEYKTKLKAARDQAYWKVSHDKAAPAKPAESSKPQAATEAVAGGIAMGLTFLFVVLFQGMDF